MIQGIQKVKSETEYRSVALDSSSSLKDFSFDRKKYYRKYVCGEDINEKEDSTAIITGKVVECLLLEPELFDSRFYLSACMTSPTGLKLTFTEALYRITREATDNEGNVKRSFEDMSRDAYTIAEFKIPYERVIKEFVGSDNEIYYNEIRTVRANNLTVVTTKDIENAERIVEELKTNPVTKYIVNLVNSDRWEIRNQFQIEGYEVDGHLFKSMLDKCIVDHENKVINIFDLKCTWSVENFLSEYFLYRRSYLQAYLYYRAILSLVTDENHEWFGYKVSPPQFIVCDSINYYNPLIYTLSYGDLDDAYKGFEYKKTIYPGVQEIIENLKWSLDTNIWNISRENYINNGIVPIFNKK